MRQFNTLMKFVALFLLFLSSFYILVTGGSSHEKDIRSLNIKKLKTWKSLPVREGESFRLSCKLPEGFHLRSCEWMTPEGKRLLVRNNSVTDEHLEEVEGISSLDVNDPKRECGLRIDELGSDQAGIWICRIGSRGENQDQEAYVSARDKITDFRLPRHQIPVKYDVKLIPFLIPDNFTIDGSVVFRARSVEPSDNITLHISDMVIDEKSVKVAKYVDDSKVDVSVVGHGYDDEREFYIIRLGEDLPKGEFEVSIKFIGNLNEDLSGLYRSNYKDEEGNIHHVANTQFQATDARRAFPCFDEPNMKAVFSMSVGRLTNMTSVSNMPQRVTGAPMEHSSEYVWDVYEDTEAMSTYLIGVLVSDFEYVKGPATSNNVEFRIWAREQLVNQTRYAAEVGPRILEEYERYFDVPFPLPKQDMAAVVELSFNAMENWGIITYREAALLYDADTDGDSVKEYIVNICAHELAHQWFGNLVTLDWWNDLWLNEGFATFIANVGTEFTLPDHGFMDRFALKLQDVLRLDALPSSHPISVKVNNPDEINEIFDKISYIKGGSVIRMMSHFLTSNILRKGIFNYLNYFKYGNAKQDDLWDFLNSAAQTENVLPPNSSVKEIMDTWTLQPGFPVVTISRENDSDTVKIEATRFSLGEEKSRDNDSRWWIPISLAHPGGNFSDTFPKHWLDASSDSAVVIEGVRHPVIVNVQQTGYYRVNYDSDTWASLRESLERDHTSIHRINRAQLIDDGLNLAAAGYLDYNTALGITEYLPRERNLIPWSSAMEGFSYLVRVMRSTEGYGLLKTYLRRTIEPLFQRLRFRSNPGEEHMDVLLRTKAMELACRVGVDSCRDGAIEMFNDLVAGNGDSIDPEARPTVYCVGVSVVGREAWDFLWQKYGNGTTATSERSDILEALACAEEESILEEYLDMTVDGESGVKKQDGARVISRVASSRPGSRVAWNWVRNNWSTIRSYFDHAVASRIGRIIASVTSSFNTEDKLRELEKFKRENRDNLGSAENAVDNAIESVKKNIFWMENYYDDVVNWLESSSNSVGVKHASCK